VFKTFSDDTAWTQTTGTQAAQRWLSISGRTTPVGRRDIVVRALDIGVALLALVVFGPLMLAIAASILISGGGPVLFVQSRIGRGGKAFRCFKFRTMHNNADALLADLLARDPHARAQWDRDCKLRHDPRIVGIGNILRRTSLDELPQIFNVLAGDMSIVGPRPVVVAETHRYGRYLTSYCAVRPGITGLWQISGRNTTTYRRRIACDVLYARSKSPLNDIRIIVKTVPVVLFARGAY
jgi:exopolysaccharide production protein ExoY